MDKSEFFPTACSTVSKKKYQKKIGESKDDYSICSASYMSNSNNQRQINTINEPIFELEEQREFARNSLQRANNVARIPSKYFHADFSKSESKVTSFNESTFSESDLLQSRKNTSTPRSSLISNSRLGDVLTEHSSKIMDSNISIDNLVSDFKKVLKTANDQSYLFKSGEEAASMLLADELSWRLKNEMPIQEEQFSQSNCTDKMSFGEFFREKCNTLSDLTNAESPNVTREPVPLIEPSCSLIDEKTFKNKEQQSLSISAIQKMLESEDTPKRTVDYLCKLGAKTQTSSLQNKHSFSLPVSKDSSYTSDHSENDVIKQICNKENLNTLNINVSPTVTSSCSRTSSRASSALTSLQNDKLPIETKKTDLVWGCVKPGKSVTQEFIIRNKSSKRVGLQLTLNSQEFKIRKGNRRDSEPLSNNKIYLHPHESKPIIISFIPTKVGAAIDELYFLPLDPNLKQTKKQCVKLFGYGGSCKVDFHNLTRDTTGKFWLSIGKLGSAAVLTTQFHVKNKGELPVFIHTSINSLESTKLQVDSNFFVLASQEEKTITVSYKPSNEDYNFLHKSLYTTMVSDLGNLNITFGSEVDRGRIRKICEKSLEYGFTIDPFVSILKEKIKGEMMPVDLNKFREPPGNLQDIMKLLHNHQVMLTLERDPEQTIVQQYTDDSGLYQSLYQDNTVICNKSGITQSCYVAPSIIVLTPPYKNKDTIFLMSGTEHKLQFTVGCRQLDVELTPREGILEPYKTAPISVKYLSTNQTGNKSFKVEISVESEIFEVDVKVECLSLPKSKK